MGCPKCKDEYYLYRPGSRFREGDKTLQVISITVFNDGYGDAVSYQLQEINTVEEMND